jgi:hypothetical protein
MGLRDQRIEGVRTIEQNRRLWAIVGKLAAYVGGREKAEALMREQILGIKGLKFRVRDLRIEGLKFTPLIPRSINPVSTMDLTAGQAEEVIRALAQILRRKEKACTAPEPDELPTQKQMDTIDHLRADLGMNQKGLNTLSNRIIKKPWPQTRAEAKKIHEALSAMTLRSIPREEILQRVAKLQFLDAGLTAWEKNFLEDLDRRLANGERLFVGSLKKLKEIEGKRL